MILQEYAISQQLYIQYTGHIPYIIYCSLWKYFIQAMGVCEYMKSPFEDLH